MSRGLLLTDTRSPHGFSCFPGNSGFSYIEDFDERALDITPNPPLLWLWYMDDTFTVFQEYFIAKFTDNFNSIDLHIQFTVKEKEGHYYPS